MRPLLVLSLIVMMSILLPAQSARAESGEARITADEMAYDYHLKQMEAWGNVKIVYKDITVESDQAFVDQNQNILVAKGSVRITKKDSNYTGNLFLYYLNREEGLLTPIQAEIRDQEINGPVQMKAVEGYLKGETVTTINSKFSGCDREKPHYHLTAKQAEYYPGDRVVLHRVWYWEHGIPILYLPFLYISLKPDRDNFEVEIGHNQLEGWYARIGYNYIWDGHNTTGCIS